MTARLYIAVPLFNRVDIAHHCLPTLRDSMSARDHLALYDDGSVDDMSPLAAHADTFHRSANMGVDAQRRNHIADFIASGRDFLYFTDPDAIHSPAWRTRLLDLHAGTGYLACGYRTATHEAYANNVYARKDGHLFTRFAPGVSMLLSRKQVEVIAANLPPRWDFDWAIPAMLGYKCAVTEQSVVDHIGLGGMHDKTPLAERAMNPTPWLISKRAEILASLGLSDA